MYRMSCSQGLDIFCIEVPKSCYSCQSRNACKYPEIESLLLVEHVEDVDILYTNWIVKVLSSERIFKVDDIRICAQIIVENLSISNYYIIFLIFYINPGLCLLGLGGLVWDIEDIAPISELSLETIESKIIGAEDNHSFFDI